jgi:hypothetical protein
MVAIGVGFKSQIIRCAKGVSSAERLVDGAVSRSTGECQRTLWTGELALHARRRTCHTAQAPRSGLQQCMNVLEILAGQFARPEPDRDGVVLHQAEARDGERQDEGRACLP